MMTADCPAEPAAYRLFFLDEQGRISKSKKLKSCQNDEDALTQARCWADGRTLELYDGCRLVLRLEAARAVMMTDEDVKPASTAPQRPK